MVLFYRFSEYNMFSRDFKKGQETEDLFRRICNREQLICIKTTKEVDITKHIDFYITIDNKVVSVDVKSRNYDGDWVYVELKNVMGDRGWAYGESCYIAFEREDMFLLVSRKSIVELIENKNMKERVNFAKSAYYKLYTRKNRKDLITKINLKDIKEKNKITIKK
jgi:hypothetical protein